eukprot:7770677-Pyramimonas_sp.AAC.1
MRQLSLLSPRIIACRWRRRARRWRRNVCRESRRAGVLRAAGVRRLELEERQPRRREEAICCNE